VLADRAVTAAAELIRSSFRDAEADRAGRLSSHVARMSGDRFDYSSERQRHEKFVGRAGLLARLDQLLVDSETDRWVVITGGPGMGKSALLAAWLARRQAAGALVPHHFIRRGAYDWDDPAKLVGSLVAQIDEGFPDLREPTGDERMHPATRLGRALSRVSEKSLRLRGERLVVLIDGLDEYDPPAGSTGDPLAAFLPDALPPGVRLGCASRPRHPYVSSLEARDGELVQIDLDAPDHAIDNEATVRAFWERVAKSLGLDPAFVEEAVARAGGNVQHAVQLRKRLAVLAPEQRRVEDIPRGLVALIEKSWERIAVDPVVVNGLGILCAAREALTLDELGAVAGWSGDTQRRAFVRTARELLVETPRPGGQPEYRLHHDSIRGYSARAIGDDSLRAHHSALARRHAIWPLPGQAVARRYALRHALIHRAEAGDWAGAWQLAADMSFLEAKCRELGVHETEADIARVAERCRASGDAVARGFDALARVLGRESHWLRAAPDATAALVWNRLRRFGWSANELDDQLRVPVGASFLRVRHPVGLLESPAIVRDLEGHTSAVMACAVTADGQRIVSASADRTLKVWELASGRALSTLEGHAGAVRACAVTMDGRRIVSASEDRLLKVWDLESGRTLATLEGHAAEVRACVVTADDRRAVSASFDQTLKVWDLESGRALATLEGHAAEVRVCVVTADDRRVVSASDDCTLRVWDLETGRLLDVLKGHTDRVISCAVTTDGRRAVSASADRTLKIWDLETGHVLDTLKGHTDRVTACSVTVNGRRVVSASDDRMLKVWELESGRSLSLEDHARSVTACAATVDDGLLLDSGDGHKLATVGDHTGVVNACTIMGGDRRAISASNDRTMKIWDTETGRVLATLEGHIGWVKACAVTADNRRVISASYDRTLKVWDLESGRSLATLEGHTAGLSACAVIGDGWRVISASLDQTLKVWDVECGRELATLKGHTSWVTACAVTLDGRRVVSASRDRMLKVWDLESGHPLSTLEGHAGGVTACAVTADGRRVVSASHDRTLRVWDLDSGRPLATLEGHADEVLGCAVTLDGRCVVSASRDRTLKVWDLQTYACCLTHRGDASYYAVATSATAIVAGDSTGGVSFLDWPKSTRSATPCRAGDSNGSQRGPQPAYATSSPRPQMKKHTILFLAANPVGTNELALGREARAIHEELKRSGHRDCFEFVTRWAAEPLDLLRALRELRPTVVHFSGHGGRGKLGELRPDEAQRRDVVGEVSSLDVAFQPGLFFQDTDGRPQLVSTGALEETFKAAGDSVQLVVLNACYSDPQAEALAAHVDCVVGIVGSILDDAARYFAVGFYGGLGERQSVAAAYKQGRAAIRLVGFEDTDRPKLKVREGVDASQIVLAADPS
jgi:WD40 repeat protein